MNSPKESPLANEPPRFSLESTIPQCSLRFTSRTHRDRDFSLPIRSNYKSAMYESIRSLERLYAERKLFMPDEVARQYAIVGAKEKAIAWLLVAYKDREGALIELEVDPAGIHCVLSRDFKNWCAGWGCQLLDRCQVPNKFLFADAAVSASLLGGLLF
jgi:hypothetical protein